MNRTNYKVIPIIIIILLSSILTQSIQASKREIMVGDIFKIKIQAPGLSRIDLLEKFSDFEIVNVNKEDNTYLISLRSFKTGIKQVKIADKEITIKIVSLLDNIEIDMTKLYEPELDIKDRLLPLFVGKIVSFIILMLLIFRLIILLYKLFAGKYRKKDDISPYEIVMLRLKECEDQELYFTYLTDVFKEYIAGKYGINISSKTANEIIEEIGNNKELAEYIGEIEDWLKELEQYKYQDLVSDSKTRQNAKKDLIVIINKIESMSIYKENKVEKGLYV